jgi:NADH-ubiquinone oxidoreductase chain 4
MVENFISFYVTFESTLPLLFFLIGLFGASQKFRAGFYIFLYTLFGSLFMLLSFVKMGGDLSSTSFHNPSSNNFSNILQI